MEKAKTEMGKSFDKDLNTARIQIEEYDKNTLNEKKYKLKRKIFSLPKMETLVHSDPRLSNIYDEMAADGKDKYGYHYNETIMNIIFNDYILNSPKYLQKYKNAKPSDKKRRDKFGIDQLKKKYHKDEEKKEKKDMDETKEMTNFSRYGKGSGTIDSNVGDLNETVKSGDIKSSKDSNKPQKGEFAGEKFSGDSIAKKPKEVKEEKEIDESTSTSGAGDYQYAGPGIWSKTGKPAMRKPFWIGGQVIGESNYLTDPIGFKEFYELLKESVNYDNISEHHKDSKKDQIDFILKRMGDVENIKGVLSKLPEDAIEKLYNEIERDLGMIDETDASIVDQPKPDSMSNKPEPLTRTGQGMEMGISMNEHHLESRGDRIKFILNAQKQLDKKLNAKELKKTLEDTNLFTDDMIEQIYFGTEKELKKRDIDPMSISIDKSKEKPIKETDDFDDIDIDSLLEETEKVLSEIGYYKKMKKGMNEEKKTPSMVNKERLGGENKKNFKSDLQTSGTREAIEAQKDLQHKDQQTEVGDPKKFSEDIEKESIKKTDGGALKNKGDSVSDGEHIPKRNHTTEEQKEVDLTRKGMQDWQYDNKPSEKFEERMKDGMGEDLYKQRQEKMERSGKAPMYNKDSQPVTDGDDKDQINKFKNESVITGLYFNDLGKRKVIDFELDDVKWVNELDESWHKIHTEGLGNTYTNIVEVNESLTTEIKDIDFYLDNNNNIYSIKKTQKLNEGEIQINEGTLNKMKHLFGYNPKDFTDTNKTKINRGF